MCMLDPEKEFSRLTYAPIPITVVGDARQSPGLLQL